MTRNAKVHKLCNAVREYRGIFYSTTGEWRRKPNPNAKPRIESWLRRLKLDIPTHMAKIEAFVTVDDMRAWIKATEKEADDRAAGKCTCGEPHISEMVEHRYDGKPCFLKERK